MNDRQLAYIEYEVLIDLQELCGLTQQRITEILNSTDMLEFIDASYELYHTQGIYTILEDLREHLKEEYNISIPLPQEYVY